MRSTTTTTWADRLRDEVLLLPSLNVARGLEPIPVSEFDAASVLAICFHVAAGDRIPLVLLAPAAGPSLRWALLSLASLCVLDDLTTTRPIGPLPSPDTIVCFDGLHYARFLGLQDYNGEERLRLLFDDCVHLAPRSWEARMQVAPNYTGPLGGFNDARRASDPLEQAFAIANAGGFSALRSRVLLVGTRARAETLFAHVRLNGIDLVATHLLSFATMEGLIVGGAAPGPLVVVPSLSAARAFMQRHTRAATIVVDGMAGFIRGRDDLPFILAGTAPPAVVVWTEPFEYSSRSAARAPAHRAVGWTRKDLQTVAPHRPGSVAPAIRQESIVWTAEERRAMDAVGRCLAEVSTLEAASQFLAFQVRHLLQGVQRLLSTTPANGRDLVPAVSSLLEGVSALMATTTDRFRQKVFRFEGALRLAHMEVGRLPAGPLAKARKILDIAAANGDESLTILCALPQQIPLIQPLIAALPKAQVCCLSVDEGRPLERCLVTGWLGAEFALRLDQSGIPAFTVLADSTESQRWTRFQQRDRILEGAARLTPILMELSGTAAVPCTGIPATASPALEPVSEALSQGTFEDVVPCALVWLDGDLNARALARSTLVLVVAESNLVERLPLDLVEGDLIVLPRLFGDIDAERLLTDELIRALDERNPELISTCQEWRRALREYVKRNGLDAAALRRRLRLVEVSREESTVRSWLDIENRSVLAPRKAEDSLAAIWRLAGALSASRLDSVQAAAAEVRRLHTRSHQAAWAVLRGRDLALPVEEGWLTSWAERVRQRLLDVRRVASVQPGEVPRTVLGWPVPPEFVRLFTESRAGACSPEAGQLGTGPAQI